MRQAITQEMVNHFETRTNFHISLVEKYMKRAKLIYNEITYNPLSHDQSKFEEPEYSAYILVNWKYFSKDNNLLFSPSKDQEDEMNEATLHHITTNKHHPEYWDTEFSSSKFNFKNRDDVPSKIVNAVEMPNKYIIEMTCDWMAMSEERNGSPFDWAEKNINIRWLFTDKQAALIYEILYKIWDKTWNEVC